MTTIEEKISDLVKALLEDERFTVRSHAAEVLGNRYPTMHGIIAFAVLSMNEYIVLKTNITTAPKMIKLKGSQGFDTM